VSRTSKNNQYQCLCPAHNDRTASLSIKFNDDGRVLMNCFAGCDIENIIGSVGLSFNDIIPNRIDDLKPIGKIFNPYAVLKSLRDEIMIVLMMAISIRKKEQISNEDYDRFIIAYQRIREGYENARR
jgi:hypothetical protein